MTCQQNCQPLQLHGGFSVEREICTVKLHTVEVLRRLFGSQRFLRNCPSPELPTLAVTRCHFGPDTQNWIPQKFYGQLSGVVAKLHTWAVSRRLFGPEKSIKSSGREIKIRLAGWCAGLIDSLPHTTRARQLQKLKHFLVRKYKTLKTQHSLCPKVEGLHTAYNFTSCIIHCCHTRPIFKSLKA